MRSRVAFVLTGILTLGAAILHDIGFICNRELHDVPAGLHHAEARRTLATQFAIRAAASSISASVSGGPKLKRIAERSTGSGTPIAWSTGEGSRLPLEQAEPVAQATPARSRLA